MCNDCFQVKVEKVDRKVRLLMDLKQQLLVARQVLSGTPIPAIPTEVLELQALFASTEFPDFGEVATIIGRNTVLTGELIKMANDPCFVKENADPIQSVRGAVDALGLIQLKNLVVGLAFKAGVQDLAFANLIDHSLDVAKVASELCMSVEGIRPDTAYLAGLFHNAGAIMLALKYDDYEKYFFNTLTNYYSGVAKEVKRYQTSHGVFGLLVAKKWNLDSMLSQVILVHHQKDLSLIRSDDVRTLVALIQLANGLVSEVSFGSYMGAEVKSMMESATQELMIEQSVVDEVRMSLISSSLVGQV